jgi:hypothetical protein
VVTRYASEPEEGPTHPVDGLPPGEGVFLMCSGSVPVVLVPGGEREPRGEGSWLFVSARKQIIWTCAQCGLVQRPGDSSHACRICQQQPDSRGPKPEPRVTRVSSIA